MASTPPSTTQLKHMVRHQRPFADVAPMLAAALILGAGGGLVLASILTVTQALRLPLGAWWLALAQAHGQLQIYGWIGLFVLGVALYFLPRLRGAPLIGAWGIPWILAGMATALVMRTLSQPLVALTDAVFWRALLVASGVLECVALVWAVGLLLATGRAGVPLRARPALWGILPFVAGAIIALSAAACVNLANCFLTASAHTGLVPGPGDDLNVTLGLLGFLVPMALAMSARALPMYAGLDAFPRQALWPLAAIYQSGVLLLCVGTLGGLTATAWTRVAGGLGMLLSGGALIAVVGMFLRLMRTRGRLPPRVMRLAPTPAIAARAYRSRVAIERTTYGPFVALIVSAFLWAILGGVLLVIDGIALALGGLLPVSLDAARHSLAIGFIVLLLCGVAPRLIPGFSGGHIRTSKLVTATLWLGNAAAFLRVVSLLAAPALASLGASPSAWGTAAFGLSGPIGLALGICLAINLWPALFPKHSDP